MGHLIYNSTFSFDMDDRTLAHLRLVVMNKLRRGEPFMMALSQPPLGKRWLWVSADIPLTFHFYGHSSPQINPRWVDELMRSAHSSDGLTITREKRE